MHMKSISISPTLAVMLSGESTRMAQVGLGDGKVINVFIAISLPSFCLNLVS